MNKTLLAAAAIAMFAANLPAQARDERTKFPVADAMTTEAAKAQLSPDIKFFFGDAAHPAVERSFGTFTSNKKTNAVGKSDKMACEWAFLSAMLSFQNRVTQLGGNAVINIKSNYKSVPFTSAAEYDCGAGNIMVGVTFQGEVVKLK